jgi:hypothetical protein
VRVEEPPQAAEVVDYGADRPRRRWTYLVVPLLLVAAVLAYVLDDRARQREYDALLVRVAAADEVVDLAESQVVSIKQYVAPTLFAADAPRALRRDLARLVLGTADEGALDVARERERVLALEALPWHGSQADAQAALVSYLEEREGRLETVLANTSSDEQYPALDDLRAALAAAAPDSGRAQRATTLLA